MTFKVQYLIKKVLKKFCFFHADKQKTREYSHSEKLRRKTPGSSPTDSFDRV